MNGARNDASIAIRPLVADDLDALAALHETCFSDGWDAEGLASLLTAPGAFALLAIPVPAGGEKPGPLGFIVARAVADEAEIVSLGVPPAYRRRGIGRRLLEAVMVAAASRGAARLFLEVAEDNEGACALYRSAGLVPVGRRPNYYHRPGGDMAALLLARDIAGPTRPASQTKDES